MWSNTGAALASSKRLALGIPGLLNIGKDCLKPESNGQCKQASERNAPDCNNNEASCMHGTRV